MSGAILVVSSCTATKLQAPDGRLHCAESLYAGQQHVRLMRGIEEYRDAGKPAGELRFRILSAFYGLLPSGRRVSSYDHSFSGLPMAAIHRQGREQNVPEDIRKLLRKPFGFGLLLLGDPYLRACDLDADVELGGPLLCFCSPAVARRMPKIAGLRTIPLANAEARRFSCGLIALKGELGGRLLSQLATEPETLGSLASPRADILRWLERSPSPRRVQPIAA
ncbi:MAG TPA: hypothetical protein VES65_01640 [Solirubrobacteraceae bacterium]|nr:hypothetical protein [Solirubrobacteraceae bacterium]